jgi:DNA-binding MurR/RpiR family transcriptional regulator
VAVFDQVRAVRGELSASERRVAEVVLETPEAVAFGTVAHVAGLADTSSTTVIRLANRLGFAGYRPLQEEVRDQLSSGLRPAVRRIRTRSDAGALARTLDAEVANVTATLQGVDRAAFDRAGALLADPGRAVHVLPSEQARPVGSLLATNLGLLRDDVRLVFGTEFRVASLLARVRPGDVLVAVDLRRYERWVLRSCALGLAAGAVGVTITDSALSPLGVEGVTFAVHAGSSGPFDSLVGAHVLVNALVADVADRCRGDATRRLDRLEQAWRDADVLES